MINILFGAGASFGSGPCVPHNPPLGNYLFEDLRKLGGEFSKLPENIVKEFDENGFEAGMALVEDNSTIINPMQKEIACYLSKFKIKPENAYFRFFNKIKSCLHNVTVSTLNYDLLIEQALWNNGLNVDYNAENQGVKFLKIHGSSNFLPYLPPTSSFRNITIIGAATYFEGLETRSVPSHDDVLRWCNDPHNECLSPVFAIYQKGKRVVINSRIIEESQKKFVQSINESTLNIIVGVKYIPHDNHVWDVFAASGAPLIVVDPYPDETIRWADTNNLQNVTVMTCGFSESVIDLARAIRVHNATL